MAKKSPVSEVVNFPASQFNPRIVTVPNQVHKTAVPRAKSDVGSTPCVVSMQIPSMPASNPSMRYISGGKVSSMPPSPKIAQNPISACEVITNDHATTEPYNRPWRKRRMNDFQHAAAKKQLKEAEAERHRENEHKRHVDINTMMKRCISLLPVGVSANHSKDRKITSLQTVVAYVCFLEKKIKELSGELNLDARSLHSSDVISGTHNVADACVNVQNLNIERFQPVELLNGYLHMMGFETIKTPQVIQEAPMHTRNGYLMREEYAQGSHIMQRPIESQFYCCDRKQEHISEDSGRLPDTINPLCLDNFLRDMTAREEAMMAGDEESMMAGEEVMMAAAAVENFCSEVSDNDDVFQMVPQL
ncbi:uncharacterized protein [Watersipora subatra]|uniref:uncharacterized protein isoform X2 n=1 Tax=Watersipora subatra TaxID=2589382 RepID=UPI00355AE1EE